MPCAHTPARLMRPGQGFLPGRTGSRWPSSSTNEGWPPEGGKAGATPEEFAVASTDDVAATPAAGALPPFMPCFESAAPALPGGWWFRQPMPNLQTPVSM